MNSFYNKMLKCSRSTENSRKHFGFIPDIIGILYHYELSDYLVEYLLQGIFPPKQLWKSIVYGAVNETHSNEWSLRTTSDNDFLCVRDIHRSVELAYIWKYTKSSRHIKNYICIVKLMTDIPNNTEGICVVCNRHVSDIFVHAVPHHRLITKLKGYGISGNILEWIKNFLSRNVNKKWCLMDPTRNGLMLLAEYPNGAFFDPYYSQYTYTICRT